MKPCGAAVLACYDVEKKGLNCESANRNPQPVLFILLKQENVTVLPDALSK
jgi:hypothetical protein